MSIAFFVLGYVVMPEHFHLLISEPQVGTPSTAMQSVKQRFSQRVVPRRRQRRPANTHPLQKTAGHPLWRYGFKLAPVAIPDRTRRTEVQAFAPDGLGAALVVDADSEVVAKRKAESVGANIAVARDITRNPRLF